MAHADFIHLRVHSAYSLSEGAIKVKDLVKLCENSRMPAVAVTDTGNLFGALEFSQAASGAGVQPIIGCQLALGRVESEPRNGARPAPDRIVLLVQNEAGYKNLLRLVSRAFLETDPGETPQVDRAKLAEHAEGLIALDGGPTGPAGRFLADGKREAAREELARLAEIFPGRLYVEIQRHGLPAEATIETPLIELAYELDLPLVATNDVYFADETMYEAHDALICIAEGAYVGQGDRRRLTPEHRFKTAAEMRALFADLPEAIDNTLVIARRCAYYPEFQKPILPAYDTAGGRSETEELRAQSEEGLEARLEGHVYVLAEHPEALTAEDREAMARPYRERLDYELGIIEQMGFPGYFLIVSDFIKWAKSKGIPVGPGRGSGAGSVVAWSLTITDLDPLRWGLLFERFLNPERVSMPDFDVDFCQERRDEVLHYVQDKYGHDKVAQIITFGKLQARAVVRDVGRVLQMPYPQVDRICKLIPNNPANPVTLQEAINGEAQLRDMQRDDESVARLLAIGKQLEGLYRHASTHAAGVVIGDRPLDELVPLYRDPRAAMPVTQFNMKFVEQAGLVKFDFLGLKTLSILARARDLIRRREPDFDIEGLPLDDPDTYKMISRGETTGVFQLESSGMRDALRRLRPDRFEDIIAVVALYRPGPMDNIPSYIARKHGQEEPDYLYPTLEGILKETFGIMIYQEQVMQIAQELAGFTLGQADLLRRAMGKKIKAEMEAQRKVFVEGAVARGVPEKQAETIFEHVNKFAGYGFNKSHAAAYALVAYQTAYLKANYPVEFLAACMTFDLGNTDKLNNFRQELNRLDIPILPPDVNRSGPSFEVEVSEDEGVATGIRYALAAIRNVGGQAMAALQAEREAKGRFKSLADLAQRLDGHALNKRLVEALACAGAFDSLEPNRRRVFEGAEALVRRAQSAASDRQSNQANLFGGGDGGGEAAPLLMPAVEDWDDLERLGHEFDAIGFYLSAHPLDAYEAALKRMGAVESTHVERLKPGQRNVMAGIVVTKQERTARSGNRFAFVTLSDTKGLFEVMVFAETLNRCRDLLEAATPLLVTVTAKGEEDDRRLFAEDFQPLEQAVAGSEINLKVFLADAGPVPTIRAILDREGKPGQGKGRVAFVLNLSDGREAEIELPGRYRVSGHLFRAIKSVPGVTLEGQ